MVQDLRHSVEETRRWQEMYDRMTSPEVNVWNVLDKDKDKAFWGVHEAKENNMTTAFALDLNRNSLTLGSVADGQVMDLDAEIKLKQRLGSNPVGGIIKGNFVGEIKGDTAPPITIPHVAQEASGYNIIVVGSGGTGGYLIRDLARFAFSLRETGDSRLFTIKLIDADIVEQKNVLRQNFTSRDIEKPKAEVMARRYASAFGVEISAELKMISTRNDVINLFDHTTVGNRRLTNIVVGCVDNNAARRTISEAVNYTSNIYWIDSGNETQSGQVVCGYDRFKRGGYSNYNIPSRETTYAMPTVVDLYPEILNADEDEKEETKVSCAERSLVDTQNIFINMTAAGHVLNFIRQIVMREKMTSHAVEFNTKGLSTLTHLTEDYLRKTYSKGR